MENKLSTYNKKAIAAFSTSVTGAILFRIMYSIEGKENEEMAMISGAIGALLILFALLLGFISFMEIKKTQQKGRWLAILSMLGLIIWPIVLAFTF